MNDYDVKRFALLNAAGPVIERALASPTHTTELTPEEIKEIQKRGDECVIAYREQQRAEAAREKFRLVTNEED